MIVRLIFDFYTNDRGHRTASGGPWSGHQVIRALNNRVYLGELSFRENTVTDTHEPIIETQVWERAQAILDAHGESHAHRAASGSNYVLTGRLSCPKRDKAMIGTRATGRNRTYLYYTCWNLARYDSSKRDSSASTPTRSTSPSSTPWPRSTAPATTSSATPSPTNRPRTGRRTPTGAPNSETRRFDRVDLPIGLDDVPLGLTDDPVAQTPGGDDHGAVGKVEHRGSDLGFATLRATGGYRLLKLASDLVSGAVHPRFVSHGW